MFRHQRAAIVKLDGQTADQINRRYLAIVLTKLLDQARRPGAVASDLGHCAFVLL